MRPHYSSDSKSKAKNNAYIESFVIHARILIEFLYGRPIKKDTIYAADYVDQWWNNCIENGKPLAKTDYLREIELKANKFAAHLTLAGAENEAYTWDRVMIYDEINKKIMGFLAAVRDGNKISEETKSEIRAIITAEPARLGPCGGINKENDLKIGAGATGPIGGHNSMV